MVARDSTDHGRSVAVRAVVCPGLRVCLRHVTPRADIHLYPGRIVVQVVGRAPRLLRLNIGDYGIIVNQDGSFPIPVTPGVNSHPAKPGDWLTIYAIGLGPTVPTVASGEAAPAGPLAWVSPLPTVYFGAGLVRVPAVPFYAGLTPNFVGLYQINVQIPTNAPRGSRVPLTLDESGVASNTVEIAVE